MTSDRRVVRAEQGFTLIEVLVAMLILAVGLLGLEALGIGAARSISRADRQGESALAASRVLEERIHEIRRTAPAVNTSERCVEDIQLRRYVCSRVLTQTQLATLPANSARISVTVRHTASGPVQFNLTSHVFNSRLPPGS